MKIILDRDISTTVKLNIEKRRNNANEKLHEDNSVTLETYYRQTLDNVES